MARENDKDFNIFTSQFMAKLSILTSTATDVKKDIAPILCACSSLYVLEAMKLMSVVAIAHGENEKDVLEKIKSCIFLLVDGELENLKRCVAGMAGVRAETLKNMKVSRV